VGAKTQLVKAKNQPSVDQVTGGKIPKSFVFARGKIPAQLKQLELDIRKLMLPYTALKLKVLDLSHFNLC
jgi:ribosome biogenesis protein SSF1/2